MSNKAVLLQPGKLGDILICAPIAKYYSEMGYEVYWPVFDNFYDLVSRFNYVKPVKFGISLGSDYYSEKRSSFYRGGNTLQKAITLEPNVKKSIDIFDKIYKLIDELSAKEIDPCFSFIGHRDKERSGIIETFKQQGRNWIDLKYHLTEVPLEKRWEIYCVDSSLANYVEVCPSLEQNKKFYLGSEEPHYHDYMRNILKNNWIRLDKR
jgi:hypothetical protein